MLTQREEDVIKLLLKGLSNKEISEKLSVTYNTTKAHIESIYRKLNVSNRVQAVIKYLEMTSINLNK